MKLSAKPMSSPGRNDKFPPPLMRFLRSNAGSRSRGRSRSSPMFVRKKNTAIETQEPSSPKVTCMGQVRVRRSAKQSAAKRGRRPSSAAAKDGAAPTTTRCRCWWIRKKALFCKIFKPQSNSNNKNKNKNNSTCRCKPVWPKWGFFRVGSFRRKPAKPKEGSVKSESNFQRSNDVSEAEHEEEEDDESEYEEERVNPVIAFASNPCCTPPKNALLLTRCRSAPYRSSSLASRFWGSPLRNEEETGEEEEQGNKVENRVSGCGENDELGSKRESVSEQDGKRVSETDAKLGFFKEVEDSLRDRVASSVTKSENVEELKRCEKEGECEGERPVVLTRCKSEPARTGHKFDPEMNNFWKKRRLGFADILFA